MVLTSLENRTVKNLVRLQEKKYRDQENQFIAEGWHLVEEALKAGLVEEIFVEEGVSHSFSVPVTEVSKEVMKKISTLETPSSVLALCHKKEESSSLGKRYLVLDEIQDPGNLGTLIRSSKAFHVDTIVLGKNSVDFYHPKVLRATQGMVFHCQVLVEDLESFLPTLKERKIPIYGTKVEEGEDVRMLSSSEKEQFALVLGNEGQGVHPSILRLCDRYLYLSMAPEVESLNVAVAGSILLYELDRR